MSNFFHHLLKGLSFLYSIAFRFVRNHVFVYKWVYLRACILFHCCVSVLPRVPQFSLLWLERKSSTWLAGLLQMYLFSKTILSFLPLLPFHVFFILLINISIILARILIGSALCLQINLERITILTMLSLPTHKHDTSLHLFRSSVIFIISILKFSAQRSRRYFARLTLFLCCYKWCCF